MDWVEVAIGAVDVVVVGADWARVVAEVAVAAADWAVPDQRVACQAKVVVGWEMVETGASASPT